MVDMSLEQEIKDKALALGFDAAGITDAAPMGPEHAAHFKAWLRAGYAGCMDYMHRNLDKRLHPAKLLDGAKSVIVVALYYRSPAVGWVVPTSSADPTEMVGTAHPTGREPLGKVAQYAQHEDYHPFIKDRLRELVDFIRARTDGAERFKIGVDSAPLAEKALAVRAGLGFIGRNHLLIHPQLGPQILLGEVITTAGLRPDAPVGGSCAECDRCFKACPTGALRPDGFLDASRCISCLTQYGAREEEWNDGILEHWNSAKEPSQRSTIPLFHNPDPLRGWLFGCDECLLACPFQHQAPARANPQFRWYPERTALNPREVLGWTDEEFETRLHDSPIRRPGLERLQSSARLCLGDRVP